MKITSLLFFIFFLSTIHAQVNVEEGLVAYYPFNESLDDNSVNNNTAFSDSAPLFVEDIEGNSSMAAYFDGDKNYVEINDNGNLNFSANQNFAISMWIKPDLIQDDLSGSVNDILSKWNSALSDPYPYTIRFHNQTSTKAGKLAVGRYGSCGENPIFSSETSIADGEWHHIVFQKKDGILELYIDCNLEGTIEDNTVCETTNNFSIIIGQRNLNLGVVTRKYKGLIDEIRIYDRFLDDEVNEALCDFSLVSTKEEKIDIYSEVVIGPNPVFAHQKLRFHNLDSELIESVTMYTTSGNAINLDNTYAIPTSLSSGMYYCLISLENGDTILRKLIIQSLRV